MNCVVISDSSFDGLNALDRMLGHSVAGRLIYQDRTEPVSKWIVPVYFEELAWRWVVENTSGWFRFRWINQTSTIVSHWKQGVEFPLEIYKGDLCVEFEDERAAILFKMFWT